MGGGGKAVLVHCRMWCWPVETKSVQPLVVPVWSSCRASLINLSGMCFCVGCVDADVSKKLLFLDLTRKVSRSFETSRAARPSHDSQELNLRVINLFVCPLKKTDSEESLVPVIQLEADAITTHRHRFSPVINSLPHWVWGFRCDFVLRRFERSYCLHQAVGNNMHIDKASPQNSWTPPPSGFLAPQLVSCLAKCSRSPRSNHKLPESRKAPMAVWFRIPFFRDMTPNHWRFEVALCLRVRARGPTFGPSDAKSCPHVSCTSQLKLSEFCVVTALIDWSWAGNRSTLTAQEHPVGMWGGVIIFSLQRSCP